ncbi:hypothetical protein HKX48_004862 [Thoreauomyces humboldtii]|nr:hypothetical protein HKX48_004862 [Thoreauomyces humboldtii]
MSRATSSSAATTLEKTMDEKTVLLPTDRPVATFRKHLSTKLALIAIAFFALVATVTQLRPPHGPHRPPRHGHPHHGPHHGHSKGIPTSCALTPPFSDGPLYPANRARLRSLLPKAFLEANATIALPTGSRAHRDDSDMEVAAWRTSANVLYVLGELYISDALVILEPTNGGLNATLFLKRQDQRETVFEGGVAGAKYLKRTFGLESVRFVEELEGFLEGRAAWTFSKEELARAIGSDQTVEVVESEDVRQAFHESRFVKSQGELDKLAYASQVAAWAHGIVEREIETQKDDVNAITLASLFAHVSSICGSRLQAYPAIVGAGTHASVLHYRTGESPLDYHRIPSHPPTAVLVDAAGEYDGYASDLTRTYARRGRRSDDMKSVHRVVEKAQRATVEAYGEGVDVRTLEKLSATLLLEGLIDLGLFVKGVGAEELFEAGALYIFMPHGLGHPVGLDVHDPTPAKYIIPPSLSISSIPSVFNARLPSHFSTFSSSPLAPSTNYTVPRGHVMTIEPGVYFIPALWDMLRSEQPDGIARFVDWDVAERFIPVGGVRIEDVVMVGLDGKVRVVTQE